MAYSRQDLIEWVMARMDELSSGAQVDVASPTIFGRELDEATTQILMRANRELVYCAAGSKAATSCFVNMNGQTPLSIIIPLEQSFLRFLRVKLNNWVFPVEDIVSTSSLEYTRQRNSYQRATPVLPLAVIIPYAATYDTDKTCMVALELFPAPADLTLYDHSPSTHWVKNTGMAAGKVALITELSVLSKMVAEAAPEALMDAIVWEAAGRCLTSLRNYDAAKIALSMSQAKLLSQKIGMKGEDDPPQVKQGK